MTLKNPLNDNAYISPGTARVYLEGLMRKKAGQPTLPVLISVPHAGCSVPREVSDICILSRKEMAGSCDSGAEEIFFPLKAVVDAFVSTDISRLIVDVNRPESESGSDGAMRTHTGCMLPVYDRPVDPKTAGILIEKYYRSYYSRLAEASARARMGLDCHTMSPPDNSKSRTASKICIGNGDGTTCPERWMEIMLICFVRAFDTDVSVNDPFSGGHIIRSMPGGIPWIQIEISTDEWISNARKSEALIQALIDFYRTLRRAGLIAHGC